MSKKSAEAFVKLSDLIEKSDKYDTIQVKKLRNGKIEITVFPIWERKDEVPPHCHIVGDDLMDALSKII